MNLEDGINQLARLFESANECMERKDYSDVINEYNKIIELVQTLRKPFDNGEVSLNVVTEVFPRLLQAEKTAHDAIFVAQLAINAQQENKATEIDNFDSPNLKKYYQHMGSATGYIEKGDYNSAIGEYNEALNIIQLLRLSVIKQAGKAPTSKVSEAMEEVKYIEIIVRTGLSDAYSKIGNHQKSAEEEKYILDLLGTSDNKNSYNAQNGGCFATIFVMFMVLSILMFV
ncbi:MAG: hypothetical protein IJS29_01935 [Selenomonadaceae bacterium]|nr:hypothetical protein [Selenomonadaceae bacterium]